MLEINKNKKYYCWACDYSDNTGEGNLARLFIEKNYSSNSCRVYTIKKVFHNEKVTNIINYKYISPFIGVIFCWYYFIKGKRVIYINYLPLWNFLLFIILPPKTILGPITGGANYSYGKQFIIRNYFFPIFYVISNIFLELRNTKKIFSTNLLKKNLFRNTRNNSKFNYIFNFINEKKNRKKEIDFLIYYNKHKNKEKFFPYEFIYMLLKNKFKIYVFGDYLNITNLYNLGYLKNFEVQEKLAKTKYSLVSGENFYSIYTLECINNHVKVLVDCKFKKEIKYFKKSFLLLDFKKNITKKELINLK